MAIDDEYELAVQKGNVLLQLMLADDRKAGQLVVPPRESVQSNFTALENMDDQGFEGEVTEACVNNTTFAHLAPILQALGVEHKMACDGGKNVMIKHTHSQVWNLDGIVYPVSTRIDCKTTRTNMPSPPTHPTYKSAIPPMAS
jgi:hypothetical protein